MIIVTVGGYAIIVIKVVGAIKSDYVFAVSQRDSKISLRAVFVRVHELRLCGVCRTEYFETVVPERTAR